MRSLPLVLLRFSAGLTVVQSSCEVYYQSGTCILDDECASAGKTSTPNFCPNDPQNIQCLTENTEPRDTREQRPAACS
ncbi:hypothetical protein I7I48_11102 [Histoplasma ohiense]|nr:hypothetical protein I7I48_11102 [Histoplasma ohiense (nom. inval.)]